MVKTHWTIEILQGYPTIKEDAESERHLRRSSRKPHPRITEQEEDEEVEHEEPDVDEDRRETRRSTRTSTVSPKDGSRRSMRFVQNESSMVSFSWQISM